MVQKGSSGLRRRPKPSSVTTTTVAESSGAAVGRRQRGAARTLQLVTIAIVLGWVALQLVMLGRAVEWLPQHFVWQSVSSIATVVGLGVLAATAARGCSKRAPLSLVALACMLLWATWWSFGAGDLCSCSPVATTWLTRWWGFLGPAWADTGFGLSGFAPALVGVVADAVALVAVAIFVRGYIPMSRPVAVEAGATRPGHVLTATVLTLALAAVVLASAAWQGPENDFAPSAADQLFLRLPAVMAFVPWVVEAMRTGQTRVRLWPFAASILGYLLTLAPARNELVLDTSSVIESAAWTAALLAVLAAAPALPRLLRWCEGHGSLCLLWLVLANAADAAATSAYVRGGVAAEANGVVAAIGLPMKVAGVTVAAVALWRLRPRWLGPCALALSVVLVWHVVGGTLSAT